MWIHLKYLSLTRLEKESLKMKQVAFNVNAANFVTEHVKPNKKVFSYKWIFLKRHKVDPFKGLTKKQFDVFVFYHKYEQNSILDYV